LSICKGRDIGIYEGQYEVENNELKPEQIFFDAGAKVAEQMALSRQIQHLALTKKNHC
jgi:hypothetical protein